MTTQLDSSIGFKKNTGSYGAPVTVDRFIEFTEETIDIDRSYYQGTGLRVGSRAARSGRRVLARDGVAGDISLEVPTKGIGALLELLLGTASSTLVPATTVYQQVFTPIKNDFLPSATIQKGVPRLGANIIDAYTAHGMVCSNFEFSMGNTEVLKLKTSWLGREVVRDVTYATPSYPTNLELFSFASAGLVIGGAIVAPTATALATGGTAVANVREFSLSFDNGLDSNGFNMGSQGKRSRPPAVGVAVPKGKITAEYDAIAFRDAVLDNTPISMIANFEGPTEISTGYKPTLQIVLPDVRFDPGELPKSNGGDVITQSLDFSAFDNLVAAQAMYLAVRTADTAL